jgi:cytochrome c-type biogenesis protein CcmH
MSLAFLVFAATVTPLEDPRLEARAQAIEADLRCVVCENEPISQSTAPIATDMRQRVRERVAAGDSDAAVRDYFRERYGAFVVMRPDVSPMTWALWAAPAAMLIGGAFALASLRRGRRDGDLSPEEGDR